MTNVPKPTFGARGFLAPPESEILTGVLLDQQDAFGGGLNPSLETPQGQIATTNAAVIGNAYDTFVKYTNQVDPASAEGRMQDGIARIYNLERKPSLPTVVPAVCSGLSGVVIPVGALAIAVDGNIYQCTEEGTIPVGGSIELQFACTVTGPIPCPDGSLNRIYKSIVGWDSIINLVDGVLGNDVESRGEFEARRQASVALNSRGSVPSVLGAVLNVDDVLDAYVTENVQPTPLLINGYTLAPNSLYVAVVGGDTMEVAEAIWSKKAPGCAYNGDTVVTVTDDSSGYSFPYPTYDVKFVIPPALSILFVVNLANNPQIPDNAIDLIRAAIISAFAGADGGPRARIGSTIFASRYYAAVAALGSWAQVIAVRTGSSNVADAVFTGSIAGFTLTVTSIASGTIQTGQTISDALSAILPGTRVVALGTGTGGVGTYTLNVTQTVASRTIRAARGNKDSTVVNINQVPTISAADIQFTLT